MPESRCVAAVHGCLIWCCSLQECGSGRRVMGMTPVPAIATRTNTAESSLWAVPPSWSMAQAATVPVAYATA